MSEEIQVEPPVKRKPGRPKKDIKYMDTTCCFAARVKQETFDKFMSTYRAEQRKVQEVAKTTGVKANLFVNTLVQAWLEDYIASHPQ